MFTLYLISWYFIVTCYLWNQLTCVDIKSDHSCDCINLLGMCCHSIIHYTFRHKTSVIKDVQVILNFNFRHKTVMHLSSQKTYVSYAYNYKITWTCFTTCVLCLKLKYKITWTSFITRVLCLKLFRHKHR
jgi:hypothetical protein